MIIKNTFRKSGFSFNLLKIPNRSSLTLNPLNNALKINKTKYAVKCCALLSNRFVSTGNFKNKKLNITSHIPINPICVIISLLIIPSSRLLGASFIYFESAGSFPSIIAPSPSITRFTNNKCVTFNGSSIPKNGATALTTTAVTLITNWNLQNFKIL